MRPTLLSFTAAALAILLLPAVVQAQPPPSPPASDQGPSTEVASVTVVVHRATPVAGVTVTASVCPEPDPERFAHDPPPAIIDTYPAQGGVVAPGALVLRASFAAPMSCYWEVTSQSDSDDDPCQDAGTWALPARTTWTMDCRLKPDAHYTVRFGKAGGHGFVGRSGRSAPPFVLSFSTSNDPPTSLETARRLSLAGGKEPAASAYVACSAKPDNAGADCVRKAATPPP
jgi:hypothetical protein